MHALIISNRPEQGALLAAVVRGEGFEPVVVSSMDAAVDAFKKHRQALVVVDWPFDEHVASLFERLRKHDPERRALLMLVVVGCSSKDLEPAFAAGADDFLVVAHDPVLERLRVRIAAERVQERAQATRVEQQLRDSIERFDLAVRGANDGLWDSGTMGNLWHDPKTNVWFSPRLKELIGFRDDEFPNLLGAWEARLHPDDHDRVIQAIVKHEQRRVPYDVEYRLKMKSGEYRWFSARGQAQWD